MTCENEILCGINKPTSIDPGEMDELEKKHAIVIEAPDKVKPKEMFEVEARLGHYKTHPNKPSHFIEWIELYHGDTFLARINLTAEKTDYSLKAKINLNHEHPLKARAKCNLHGVWEGEKTIEIEK